MPYTPNPDYFERLPDKNRKRYYRCRVCTASRDQEAHNCKAHEKTAQHQRALRASQRLHFATPSPPPPDAAIPHPHIPITDDLLTQDGMRAFLVACSSNPSQPLYPDGHPLLSDHRPSTLSESSSPVTGIDWNVFEEGFGEEDEVSPEEELRRRLCQKTLDLLNGDISDLDPPADSSDEYDTHSLSNTNNLPQKRSRAGDTDAKTAREWFPWPDRISCTIDILMHLPRSVFSRKQLDLFLWLLRVNEVNNVPTTTSTKEVNNSLQSMCGIQSHRYDGKLGHTYYVNSLAQILAQEMSNPQVRPHLHFYPEDTGKHLEETRQASAWLHEMSPDDATPMIRIHKEDYYVYEPAMLTNWTCCVPFRWYIRDGQYRARAWTLEPKQGTDTNNDGWIVRKDLQVDISAKDLLLSFPRLSDSHSSYGIPHPSRILGARSENPSESFIHKWCHTNPVLGNRWRTLSKGHRTLSVPLWMYCDDTSGNQSKKWNEHNSFLFTLAGLPRVEVSKEYNIHFLCTSNIAPPLEMLDGVVQQIEDAKRDGIWAWDCVFKEPVLLLPTPISKLGDNPMQSEFCCHVGSRGKFFCRICMVKGSDADDSRSKPNATSDTPQHSPATSIASNTSISKEVTVPGPDTSMDASAEPSKKKTAPESMQAMLRRISDFIKPGVPRSKRETQSILASFFDDAKILHTKTKLATRRTETGVKDTIQQFFFDKLFASYKGKRGTAEKQKALDEAIASLPDEITSPIWRLGLDPHQDTPVEILHVVLLGFVKYFWRDLVQNQVNNEQKQTLVTRFDSLNVSGLGISSLSGRTLVGYSGSLTGRDFRAICQVAPFIIYDMVPPEVYDAWVALSTLVPLIWQPVIEDIDMFCATLETEIQNFLIKTVKWTCAWFNKAKFHILLHLPNHIRRFGPAILFATESFESFNAVIRAKSIHSNRQAPSRDIAHAFAQGNRVRHLTSGGLVLAEGQLDKQSRTFDQLHPSDWRSVGPAVGILLAQDSTPAGYLGLQEEKDKLPGCFNIHKRLPRQWSETLTGHHFPQRLGSFPSGGGWVTYDSLILKNKDVCSIGEYVVVDDSPTPYIACVREIPQSMVSKSRLDRLPEGILLQKTKLEPGPSPLPMPRIILEDNWSFVSLLKLLCTVNTQHNCRQHQCSASGVRHTYQERIRSQQTVPVVEHRSCPEDLILNMAQMRDAVHLQKFRYTSPVLDDQAVSKVIEESVARVIGMRKSANGSRGAVRGRGRGRGQPNVVHQPEVPPQTSTSSTGAGRGQGF